MNPDGDVFIVSRQSQKEVASTDMMTARLSISLMKFSKFLEGAIFR
jgi:hypothetical protein